MDTIVWSATVSGGTASRSEASLPLKGVEKILLHFEHSESIEIEQKEVDSLAKCKERQDKLKARGYAHKQQRVLRWLSATARANQATNTSLHLSRRMHSVALRAPRSVCCLLPECNLT
jgi:hypothetical protein